MESIIEKSESTIDEYTLPQLQMDVGIWIDGYTHWLHNQNEKLITSEKLTVKVKQEFTFSKVKSSHIYITNHNNTEINFKLLIMHRYTRASKDHFSFISPSDQVIFHLANKKVFLINGQYEEQAIKQATIQPFWNMNTDQMWKCTKKGLLKYQPMAKGSAVSIFTLDISVPPHETKKASTWTVQGESKSELLNVNQTLLKNILAFPFKK
jgi:hypothetical protein